MKAKANIQVVRNATLVVNFAGSRFLIDPMLADKGGYPGIEGTPNSHLSNPKVALTVPMEEILDVDAVIVTHTHFDHWDEAAQALVPKHLPVFTQHEDDQELIRSQGFSDVRLLMGSEFNGITLTQTLGQHGSDAVMSVLGEFLGMACGVVFSHPEEKTLYIAGDTLWNQYVQDSLKEFQPEIVVLNAGDAHILGVGSVTMGKQAVYEVYQAAPQATIIVCHMEAINHELLTRQELREFSTVKGMSDRLLVPEDGETYNF